MHNTRRIFRTNFPRKGSHLTTGRDRVCTACVLRAPAATPLWLQKGWCVTFEASAVEISEGERDPEDYILVNVSTCCIICYLCSIVSVAGNTWARHTYFMLKKCRRYLQSDSKACHRPRSARNDTSTYDGSCTVSTRTGKVTKSDMTSLL